VTKKLLTILLLFLIAACGQPSETLPVPEFGRRDEIRCSTGGGDGTHDKLILRGDGLFVYQPIKGKTVKKQLDAASTQVVYNRLVAAGLLQVTDIPNRAVERYGVLLEADLGERKIRGSIGALEMNKEKHHKWREILSILTAEIED
jgi:hypothetical protein